MGPRPSRPQPQEPPAPVLTKTIQKLSKKAPETLFGEFFDLFGSRRRVFGDFFKSFWRVFGRLRKSSQNLLFDDFCRNLDFLDLVGNALYGLGIWLERSKPEGPNQFPPPDIAPPVARTAAHWRFSLHGVGA